MSNVIIGSARIGENGKITGGVVGDQKQTGTGNDYKGEVSMQSFYVHSKGWYILRPKSAVHAVKIASNMIIVCNNRHIGYDQNNRLGIIKYGIHTTTDTECDCSSAVRACIKEATGKDVGNFTTYDEVKILENSGLFEKRIAYTNGMTLYTGDVLVTKTKGHTVIVCIGADRKESVSLTDVQNKLNGYLNGTLDSLSYAQQALQMYVDGNQSSGNTQTQKTNSNTNSNARSTTTTVSNPIIAAGQVHVNNFNQNKDYKLIVDGVYGPKTKKGGVMVLQTALNLDYKSGLQVDGAFGAKSEKALKKHYVKRGETQYLVTAVEILLMLKGYNPNGVECPGQFGSGLESAVRKYQKDNNLAQTGVADATTIKSLIR